MYNIYYHITIHRLFAVLQKWKNSTQELHEQLDFQSRYNGFLNDLSKFLCFGLDNTVLHVVFCSPASMHTNTPISLLRIWLIPVSGRRSNNKLLCITQQKIWKSSTRNRKKVWKSKLILLICYIYSKKVHRITLFFVSLVI